MSKNISNLHLEILDNPKKTADKILPTKQEVKNFFEDTTSKYINKA